MTRQTEPARKEDARELAELINIAGEGIPEYIWSDMTETGETPMQVGCRRAAREEGGFSYRNARVIRLDQTLAGMLIAYRQNDPYPIDDLNDYPPVIQPLIELESKAPGSWYINALATHPACRGRGIARQLLQDTEQQGRQEGAETVSLIVADKNRPAKQLYLDLGYQVIASLPIQPYPQAVYDGDWQLMVKTL